MNVQQPQPPTELSRHLHDFPRADGRLQTVNNTLPSFSESWDDGNDSDSYQHRYTESLLMAVAVPVVLVVSYYVLEYIIRLVVHLCSCCNKRPAAASPAAGRDRLFKTRCFAIFCTALVLGVLAAGVASLARAGELEDPARDVRDAVTGISDLVDGMAASGAQTEDAATGVVGAALTLAEVRDAPDDVRRALEAMAGAAGQAGSHVESFSATVRSVSYGHAADDYAKWSDKAYGSWGYTTTSTLLGLVVLAYALTESLIRSRRRHIVVQVLLLIFDMVAFACLIAVLAVAFVQLGAMLAVSDTCAEPLAAADRVATAHLDVETNAAATARHFIYCDGTHPNPLNESVAEARQAQRRAADELPLVEQWASGEENATVRAMARRLSADVGGLELRLTGLEDQVECAEVHNTFVAGLNAACDPLTESSVRLLTSQAVLAVFLLLVRCMTVYRCCRCCYRTEIEACGGDDDMRLGLLGQQQPPQQQARVDYGAVAGAPPSGGGLYYGASDADTPTRAH